MEKLYGKQLEIMATKARLLGLDAVHTAASGHIGGSLSAMDILIYDADRCGPAPGMHGWIILSCLTFLQWKYLSVQFPADLTGPEVKGCKITVFFYSAFLIRSGCQLS